MPGPVQGVDQVPEVVGGAQPGGRRVEAGDLVAPGAAEGVLGDRHQLHVGEAQVLDVRGQLLGELAVGQTRAARTADAPRTRRTAPRARARRRAAPSTPRRCHSWCEAVHDRGGGGRAPRCGGPSGRRAGCGEPSGRVMSNLYSAPSPTPGRNSSHTPEEPSERIGNAGAVPVVEVPGDPHPARVRRPHGEAGAGHALVGHRLRAERLSTAPRAGPRRSGADRARRARAGSGTGPRDLRLVARRTPPAACTRGSRRSGSTAGEEPVAVVVQLGPQPSASTVTARAYGRSTRKTTPPRHRVGAEQRVRIVVGAGQQPPPVRGRRAAGARRGLRGWAPGDAAVRRGRRRRLGTRLRAVDGCRRRGLGRSAGASERRVGAERRGVGLGGQGRVGGRAVSRLGRRALDRRHRDGQPVGAVPGLVERPRTPPCRSRRRAAAPGSSRGSHAATRRRSPRSTPPGSARAHSGRQGRRERAA